METANATSLRYSHGAIAFHWTIALLIVANFGLVWSADEFPKPEAMQIMACHKAIGLTVLALTIGRIVWRLSHRAPEFAATLKPWERTLAKITHWLFYALMLAIPLSGWAMVSAHSGGAPVSWFGLFNIPGLPFEKSKDLGEALGEMHEVLAYGMLALLALHVGGALKHHFVNRDGALWRMIPR